MAYSGDSLRNPARPGPGVALCPAAEIGPGAVRRFVFHLGGDRFRALLVRSDAGLRGYVDWCAHLGIPLQDDRDEILRQDGLLVCAWHMARYDPATGAGVDGPCVGGLPLWPIEVGEDGVVRTA